MPSKLLSIFPTQIKFLHLFFLCMLITSACKGQDRLDLSTISFDTPNLPIEEKPEIPEVGSIYPGSIMHIYYNMEVFCFGNFKFQKNTKQSIKSTLSLYIDRENNNILSMNLSFYNNEDSENFVNYLTSTYGTPKVIEPEPSQTKNGKPLGIAAYLWEDILPNRSIILSKSYGTHNGEWSYNITIDYVPTKSAEKFNVDDTNVNAFQYLLLMQPGISMKENIEAFNNYINNLPNAN